MQYVSGTLTQHEWEGRPLEIKIMSIHHNFDVKFHWGDVQSGHWNLIQIHQNTQRHDWWISGCSTQWWGYMSQLPTPPRIWKFERSQNYIDVYVNDAHFIHQDLRTAGNTQCYAVWDYTHTAFTLDLEPYSTEHVYYKLSKYDFTAIISTHCK